MAVWWKQSQMPHARKLAYRWEEKGREGEEQCGDQGRKAGAVIYSSSSINILASFPALFHLPGSIQNCAHQRAGAGMNWYRPIGEVETYPQSKETNWCSCIGMERV